MMLGRAPTGQHPAADRDYPVGGLFLRQYADNLFILSADVTQFYVSSSPSLDPFRYTPTSPISAARL